MLVNYIAGQAGWQRTRFS